jgi:hypothetical protein
MFAPVTVSRTMLGQPLPKRPRQTASAIAAILALGASVHAGAITVTSCTDTGAGDTGNLRNSIAAAASGDTIDFTGLICPNSKITLLLGQITIAQTDLTLQGQVLLGGYTPILTIDGLSNGQTGLLRHTGTGQLSIYSLALNHGFVANNTQTAKGGCIYSSGYVHLSSSRVTNCQANTISGKAYGGGAYAKQGINAQYSTLSGNSALAGTGGTAVGGGLFSKNGLTLGSCTVSGNTASGPADMQGVDGGAYVSGNTQITYSTISGNTAHAHVGGIFVGGATATVAIQNSTISGNAATKGPIGGLFSAATATELRNSTIAFNTAGTGDFGGANAYAPGVALASGSAYLLSTMIANNSYGPTAIQNDLTLHGATATGSNNLVRTSIVSLPGDTLKNVCPLLGSLRINGRGPMTHALLSHSPAMDKGVTAGLREDERGVLADIFLVPLPYPRKSGTFADIGAFEVQQTDTVFDTAFDGCP